MMDKLKEREAIRAIRSMAEESLSPEKFENLMESIDWLIKTRPNLKGLPSSEDYREVLVVEISKGVDELDIKFIQEIEKGFDKVLVPFGFKRIGSAKTGDRSEISYGQFAECYLPMETPNDTK